MFADKLMEETEELCLQREQKEVGVPHKPVPFSSLGQGCEAGSSAECSPASSLGAGTGASEPGAGSREAEV